MIDRRTMIGLVLAAIPAAACARPAKAAELNIYKSPACGCCGAWVDHVKASGIKAVEEERTDQFRYQECSRQPECDRKHPAIGARCVVMPLGTVIVSHCRFSVLAARRPIMLHKNPR